MSTDEIQALKQALSAARSNGMPRQASYFMELRGDEWIIEVEVAVNFRVSQSTGMLIPDESHLDASEALRIAREHAISHSLGWRPAFSIVRNRGGWDVGACRSQLGGQVSIAVGSNGNVITHQVNPK